ncbi:MAG: type II toxin-antitoxin system VapB family antitoxin [Myxococcales bacterium]|nr:type II toxin-antitoxin system VapB family antitoxin [Myxococcales bacterium]
MIPMRTTLDLPDGLVDDARQALGFKSKTDTVIFALRELIRRKRLEELKNLAGKIELTIDIPKSRRRPVRRAQRRA